MKIRLMGSTNLVRAWGWNRSANFVKGIYESEDKVRGLLVVDLAPEIILGLHSYACLTERMLDLLTPSF